MKKLEKIISIILIILLISTIFLPYISKAAEEDFPINVELKRNEDNPNIINITATSTEYNIVTLKYVHQYINTENIGYFEEEHDDIITFDIIPSKTIEETFELDGYGSYTVYAKDEKGNMFLARLTVNDPNDMPQITLSKDSENPLILNIEVTSNKYTITKLKIAKKENINDNIDFSTQGEDIEFISSNKVSVKYTKISEEGLYVVYAEDSEGNKTTNQIYLAQKNTPISVNISDGTNPREVILNITDSICDIVSVKVAKASEITDFNDFETIENLEFVKGQNVNLNYTAPEDDIYVFYIEDEAGYKLMTQKRITEEESNMNISIEQDEIQPGNLTITATNNICNIVEMKIAIGDNIDLSYFENNGESISITPAKQIIENYTVTENCTINVYIKDEQGYTYMYKKMLIGINTSEPEPTKAPTITLSQNTNNPKQIDVIVQGDNTNIDEVKWAKGDQDLEYFKTNGNRIGQDKVGVVINTEFSINEIGIYTVYAKDENSNETLKTIEITNIDEAPSIEEDKTPPEINNIQNNGIYNESVTPVVIDEHLAEVYLLKDDIRVEVYQNGDTIEEEGSYILKAIDEAKNETTVKFIIDKTAPEITINQENLDNKTVEATILLKDNLTKISSVKIAKGEQDIDYFKNNGQELTFEEDNNEAKASINIIENGTYTIYTKDEAGNEKIEIFNVTTIITDEPEINDTTPPTIETESENINENEAVKITINVVDTQSQIKTIKIDNGNQSLEYFENNGTELTIKKDDKSAQAVVMIKQNGEYTIYAEDEQGNKTIKVITITNIITPEPEPDDTTPPVITGVEDGVTYKKAITPKAEDENLNTVILTKNGEIVEDYKNGDTISENGTYTLIATDKSGNQTSVEFIIDIDDEEENNTNTNNNTSTNTTTNTNTNTSDNENNTKNEYQNSNNSNNNQKNNNVISNNTSNTISKLPYAGIGNILIIGIIITSIVCIFTYIKYKKYR